MKATSFVVLASLIAVPTTWAQDAAPGVPEVLLSEQHQAMVTVGVGKDFPEFTLPAPGGEAAPLAPKYGRFATVVAVFSRDAAMDKTLLRDMQLDIEGVYNAQDPTKNKVKVQPVAIATGLSADEAKSIASQAGYEGHLLIDADGAAPAALGEGRMPRVYVLDATGKIVWFDIEYSSSTRREMMQAVAAMVKQAEAK